jgi:hypothetical protein
MKVSAAHLRVLRAALGRRTRPELKSLFKLVRTHDDRALLEAISSPRKQRRADSLVREVKNTLKPILGPAAEKGELLVGHLTKSRRRATAFEPKGLADAVRHLRTTFTDEQIRKGAKRLILRLTKLHGERDLVT